jgi:hypothetical protein
LPVTDVWLVTKKLRGFLTVGDAGDESPLQPHATTRLAKRTFFMCPHLSIARGAREAQFYIRFKRKADERIDARPPLEPTADRVYGLRVQWPRPQAWCVAASPYRVIWVASQAQMLP